MFKYPYYEEIERGTRETLETDDFHCKLHFNSNNTASIISILLITIVKISE